MRHAFLIMAYNNPQNLNRLLEVLDDKRAIIFLHIDSKSKINRANIEHSVKTAEICFLPSMNIRWAHSSAIECTLNMMKVALEYEWDYCHFITESDMPLKTLDGMDEIFARYYGKEFVDFFPGAYEDAKYKCEVFHWFVGSTKFRTSRVIKIMNHILARCQYKLKLLRRQGKLFHGSAYFSITRNFAGYCVDHTKQVIEKYRFTLAADEVWLQTLCAQSPFFEKVCYFETEHMMGNLRMIDWKRRSGSSPYTYQESDWADLKSAIDTTELCFARKFSADSPISAHLRDYLKGERL